MKELKKNEGIKKEMKELKKNKRIKKEWKKWKEKNGLVGFLLVIHTLRHWLIISVL